MSGLFGSLYSSVSGMNAGSTNLAIIADNIANTNTIGYKSSKANFSTLVTTVGGTGIYSSGGVMARAVQQIDQIGSQVATNDLMDIAVTGGTGMIPVNTATDGSGEFLYTRKGDFSRDSKGTYRNDKGMGFTLMGWKIDPNGRLPGEFGNANTVPSSLLTSLEPINIENINGSAAATTQVNISGNLRSSQVITEGVGGLIRLPATSVANTIDGASLSAAQVIIPESFANNQLRVGDSFSLTPSTAGATYTYTFGGMISSNDISGGIYGVTSPDLQFLPPAANGQCFTISTPKAGTLTFTFKTGSVNPKAGEFNSLATLANAINQISTLSTSNGQILTARVYNNRLYVAPVDGNEAMTISNVLGTLATDLGLGSTIIGVNRFSTLQGLAELIKDTPFMNAIVESPARDSRVKFFTTDPLGTLYIDATVSTPPTLGADPFLTGAVGSNVVRVTRTGHGYADGDRVKFDSITNPINGVTIVEGQPYTITYVDPNHYDIISTNGVSTLAGNGGGNTITVNPYSRILRELGLGVDDQILGPMYDPTAITANNLAGKILKTDYSMNTRVYDSFGAGHDMMMGYLKLAPNTWAIEVWASNPEEVVSTTGRTDGQVAAGVVTFNGDGTLKSVSTELSEPIEITWSNFSLPSTITFNWGTAGEVKGTVGATVIGLNDGLGQVDTEFSKKFVDQNGYAPSDLRSVQIDEDGYVVASFKAGEIKKIFKIPLVEFTNVNGLEARSGNAYAETSLSGTYNLREAATTTVGKFSGQHLEQARVELSEQLTNMIVAQKGYQASARVITTVNTLLDDLLRAIG